MPTNLKTYGIILIILAALVFLSRYYYLIDLVELTYYIFRFKDWVIILVCLVIGIQLVRQAGDVK